MNKNADDLEDQDAIQLSMAGPLVCVNIAIGMDSAALGDQQFMSVDKAAKPTRRKNFLNFD